MKRALHAAGAGLFVALAFVCFIWLASTLIDMVYAGQGREALVIFAVVLGSLAAYVAWLDY